MAAPATRRDDHTGRRAPGMLPSATAPPSRIYGSRTVTHDNEGNTAMATGIVSWFNSDKGYGFIAPEDGSADVFAHFSAIVGTGRRDLEENQRVEFDVEQGPKGLQATNIRAL